MTINYFDKEVLYTYVRSNTICRKARRPGLVLLEKIERVERAPRFQPKQRKQRPHHLQITKGGRATFQVTSDNDILLKFAHTNLVAKVSGVRQFAEHD